MKQRIGYEKIALGAAVAVALGSATSITLNAERLAEDFPDQPPTGRGAPVPKMSQEAAAAAVGVGKEVVMEEDQVFTVSPHYLMKKNGEAIVLDFTDFSSPKAHPPIPNPWWLEHDIDPTRANAPYRDEDGDGYSNREEFIAKTDPKRAAEHPPLFQKLKVKGIKKASLSLSYVTDNCQGAPKIGDEFGFRYRDLKRKRHSEGGIPAGEGEDSRFFAKAPALHRFELQFVTQKRLQGNRVANVATILDRQGGKDKKGQVYAILKGSRNGILIHDHQVELFVDAAGEGGRMKHFAVGDTFRLPFDADQGPEFRVDEIKGLKEGKVRDKNWEIIISLLGETAGARTLKWSAPK